jgi:cold-inducible RNA-binding protein
MAKLFFGNIPHSFSEQNIAQWVESFGYPVETVEIIRDRSTGNPRGFGFVVLKDGGHAREAIQQSNGERMDGRTITVNEATRRADTGSPFRATGIGSHQ